MANEKALEEKIAKLEDKIDMMEKMLTRVDDYNAICKVQSLYQHYLNKFNVEGIMSLWATSTEEITMEAGDSGVFVGKVGVRRHFAWIAEATKTPGMYIEHRANQPIIEIAKDGKSAKALWFSPGVMAVGEVKQQSWSLGKYDCVYIKEEGTWKFLHMRWTQHWESSYEKGWMNESFSPISTLRVPPVYPPDRPTTIFLPYSPYRINHLGPDIPEPYDTL